MRCLSGFELLDSSAKRVDAKGRFGQSAAMLVAGFPRIAIDHAVCGGRAIIAGTRVRVADVLEMLAGGASEVEIKQDFPYLAQEDIRAALIYAAAQTDHPVAVAAE